MENISKRVVVKSTCFKMETKTEIEVTVCMIQEFRKPVR